MTAWGALGRDRGRRAAFGAWLLALAPMLAGAEPAVPATEGAAADAPPRRLQVYQRVMPRYDGRELGSDGGCATVKFRIKHDGFVGEVEVLEAKPAALAGPAIAAMKQWQFQSFPATDEPVFAVQTFHFTPEPLRLPDEAIRAPFAVLGEDGALGSAGCGGTAAGAPAAAARE